MVIAMKFFEMTHNSPFEPKWVLAVKIHPTSSVIHWHCPMCGRAENVPSGSFDVNVEGGSSFPDFLGCGAYPLLIVSERVVTAWEKGGITTFRSFPVGISSISESLVQRASAPKYFRIEVSGECRIDFAASGAAIKTICSRCGEIETDVPYIKSFSILSGSWDGSPLFRDYRYFPRITFCSDKAKQIADAEHFSNVRFQVLS